MKAGPFSKGSSIVSEHRAKLNALSGTKREHYFGQGVRLIGKPSKTKPIGKGTINIAVNMPIKMYDDIKMTAKKNDRSMGSLVRELIRDGLYIYR